jgi:hypothetical protein
MENYSSGEAVWPEADAATIFLILDTQFGEQLLALPQSSAAWLINSALNILIARRLWADAQASGTPEITTFTYLPTWDLADFFESMLLTIEEHEGPLSRQSDYSTLIVLGLPATRVIEEIVANAGLRVSRITKAGFVAARLN